MRKILMTTAAALALIASPAAAQQARPTVNDKAPVKSFGRVSFDGHSLMIDGQRKLIWASEFHPFRLPSPDLWRDILQKMKASGFNTVTFYFDWSYHSPKQGVEDFSGIRDLDRLLTMADEEGLYVITRVGPYVNAELARGGFPGWLQNQRAQARTDDPEYMAAADEWLTAVDAIVARHQINGDGKGHKGNVILHQIENELSQTSAVHRRYMDHLYAKTRSDGINVPIFHNDPGRQGRWVPDASPVPGVVHGPNDMYAFDAYPGGACTADGHVVRSTPAPDWGFYGEGGAKGGASASPDTPGFLAEIGGGWFDYWGSNGNYGCNSVQRGLGYQKLFYGTNLANGIALQSIYMGYGGTSWGWLPAPVVFTSYDYGAAIAEDRSLRDKAAELKVIGGTIAAVPDLAGMIPAAPIKTSSEAIRLYHNRNPKSDARFLLLAHSDGHLTEDTPFTFSADLPDGHYQFPQMRLNGYDAKWLVAGVNLGGQRLVYATSEIQSHIHQGPRDLLLMVGRKGEAGRTVLRYASAPQVKVSSGSVESHFDAARGDLVLDYTHGALASVEISGGGRPPLTLLLGDDAAGASCWTADGVLACGPNLVRHAVAKGGALALTGDTIAAGPLRVWGEASRVTWNGAPVAVRAQDGALVGTLPGPAPVTLPQLAWRSMAGSPEASPGFDDSHWQAIDHRRDATQSQKPDGQPTMTMDPYGFHEGDVWYRGRFAGDAKAQKITLAYGAGGAGMAQVFLDGALIGQGELPAGMPRPITTGSLTLNLPDNAHTQGEHVLAVMVRNNGHNWDLTASDEHKEARGLIAASIEPLTGPSFSVPVTWRVQGRAGGENFADHARGTPNNGGQYGERMGWHLPAFNDAAWKSVQGLAQGPAGTNWYRSSFTLNVPKGQDATIGVQMGDPSTPRSAQHYRALIFVNGWNMGQFIAHVGPQRTFPIPEGILNHHGGNVIALAVTSDGAPENAPQQVKLVTMQNRLGGLPVRMVEAPASLPPAP
ncbi:beta-galactosidase [Novosphingobium terrae]|uniref:beta-galactosidase n=1 Tax=Novosphingobium terrae TaxID=2726189 RepID=UPI001F14832F|nr:beta-galactosidase [Novosphingobium terrae]